MASKSKLLVRSHAIQETASPPPSPFNHEIEAEAQDTNLKLNKSNADDDSLTASKDKIEQVKKQSGAVQKYNYLKENEKSEKPKFKTMGSSSSMEGASSGFISRGKFILVSVTKVTKYY